MGLLELLPSMLLGFESEHSRRRVLSTWHFGHLALKSNNPTSTLFTSPPPRPDPPKLTGREYRAHLSVGHMSVTNFKKSMYVGRHVVALFEKYSLPSWENKLCLIASKPLKELFKHLLM